MQEQTLLAIECSSELCSVALQYKGNISFKAKLAPQEHAYLVLPFVQDLLAENSLTFSDLKGIVFGQGPGAFTGLRVAASIAQGLALAHDIPLYASCSLELLARQISISENVTIVSVLDARMSELYWAVFKKEVGENKKLQPIQGASLGSSEKLIQATNELQLQSPAFFIGPGCKHLVPFLNEDICRNFLDIENTFQLFPHARDLLLSIDVQILRSNSGGIEIPMPIYVRNNVAEKSKKLLV